ncbi:MAG: type II toxin-antitoxin system VapC family toxin [Beijerinckiaceae bacterium]|nr:type II toxin-antitoxin system VapC family toxin [Beijerinckiaceae bacterium]
MTFYLDTSFVVAALTREAASPRVWTWLSDHSEAELHISEWVKTEVSAALSIKVRNRDLAEHEQAAALSRFAALCSESFLFLPIPIAAFGRAARFADRFQLSLRSGDALHLAIVEPSRMPLVTLDKRLAEAGPKLGIGTILA